MKKSIFIKVAAIVFAVSATFLCSFAIIGAAANNTVTEKSDIITVVSPKQSSVVGLDNDTVKQFSANYTRGSSKSYFGQGDVYRMNDVKLEWQADEQAEYYQVYVSEDKFFNGDTQKFLAVQPQYTLKNLIPGRTYYWKVLVSYKNGGQKYSNVYNFSTTGSVRTISLDGVSNSRDIGGLKGLNGKSIKYGMLYRSANLDSITESGKRIFKMLGIRTELDLRGDVISQSPVGGDVKLIKISGAFTVGHNKSIEMASHLDTAEYVGYFCDELRACADASNYPMLFHCAIGRDRTGTLAAYLQMLCGVSEDDIYKEFELSFLSAAGSNDTWNGAYDPFNALMLYIKAQPGETLAEKAEQYAIRMGVTQQVVDSIRNILLEG